MNKHKGILIIILLSAIFIVALYFSTFANYNNLGFELFKKSFHLSNDTDSVLLSILRFPRVTKAIIAGASIALSGMMLQAVSKNPLAEPFITGISSGAGVGIVISILFFGGYCYSLFGFIGAIIASLLVILFSGIGKFSITKLILIGLSVNMFVSSIISFIILYNPERTYILTYLLTGNISNDIGISCKALLVLFILIILFSSLLMPKMNFLRIDNSFLPHLRVSIKIYNILIIILSSIFAGLSVLTAGILPFVGIVIPQISKMISKSDYRYTFFINIFLGASFVMISDLISRIIIYPMQIPLGLVVSFILSPIFIYFLIRRGGILSDFS